MRRSKEQEAYLKACANYSHSKWALIRLSNLADALSCSEIGEIHDEVFEDEVTRRQERYDKLVSLNAPPVILKSEELILIDIKRGMGPLTRSLIRSINRRNKKETQS